MSEKISLLRAAVKKVSLDRNFIAFLMEKYLESENISQQEMLLQLRCSEEDYYKLCLSKAPDVEAMDFLSRLNSICEYAHLSVIEINKILKKANVVLAFSAHEEQARNFLMAARDKHKNNKTEE